MGALITFIVEEDVSRSEDNFPKVTKPLDTRKIEFEISLVLLYQVYGCMRVWRSEGNFADSVLSFRLPLGSQD